MRVLSQLIDARQVVRTSFGLAIAMSLSSLILWKSSWLVTPIQSAYGAHGASVLIGAMVCLASFAWSYASPMTLRFFLEKICPPVTIAALLSSYLLSGSTGLAPLNMLLGFAIPVAGTYLFIFAWFFVVATQDAENGLLSLLLAWALTVALRAFFGMFEAEPAKLAISMLLVCATWLLLLVQSRQVDASLPMVANLPREHKASYAHALGSIWKCVLYCGAFAFLGGVIRSLSIQADAMTYINHASILGGLVSALALVAIWRFRTIRYSVNHLFRVLFPLLVLFICALPFYDVEAFFAPAAMLYIVYSFMSLSMQVLCIQTAHDYGVNPVFCISFQIGIAICMQGLGYFLGDAANNEVLSRIPPLAAIALVSLAVLALIMYLTRGLSISQEADGRSVEFLSLARRPLQPTAPSDDAVDIAGEDAMIGEGAPHGGDSSYADSLSLRCDAVGREYYLSQREIEVMHLFVQGYTMAAIAEKLFISENTVKTHTRRLYTKLGINKKQQLFSLVNGSE